MKKKNKSRFKSLSTPEQRQDVSNYLTELVFLRQNHGIKLPPKFWQQVRYKFKYGREIQAVRKFIKNYGEENVLFVAMNNYITTWTNYAQVEALLQQLKEIEELKKLPKDKTPVFNEKDGAINDFREELGIKNKIDKKGMFEKLKELNDESE